MVIRHHLENAFVNIEATNFYSSQNKKFPQGKCMTAVPAVYIHCVEPRCFREQIWWMHRKYYILLCARTWNDLPKRV